MASITIQQVIDNRLCHYCGTCEGICPKNAIKSEFDGNIWTPTIDKHQCDHCGLCYTVCPGRKVSCNFNFLLGSYLRCYASSSKDKKIKNMGSSGGIVTTISLMLLKKKLVDGIVVLGMSLEKPWLPKVKIAYTPDEVMKAAQSKYVLYPVNKILREISKSDKTFAFVGIPCQIHGIKNVMKENEEIRRKIKYTIGLFCGSNPPFAATRYLIDKFANKDVEGVKSLEYRAGAFPGHFKAVFKDGDIIDIPKNKYGFVNRLFPIHRCNLCLDHTNELADISVGDAWGYGKRNTAYVILRTEKGSDIFSKILPFIEAKRIDEKTVIHGQYSMLYNKKVRAVARYNILNKKRHPVPEYNIYNKHVSVITIVFEKLFLFFDGLLQHQVFIKLIFYLPVKVGKATSSFINLFNRVGINHWRTIYD